MRNAVLVENGVPRGAIHLDAAADDSHRFVASEIQRYIELLTGGRLPVVTEPDSAPSGGLILVGGPQANDAVGGLAERGALDLGGLTADGAYVLKSVDIDGRGGMVVAGADDAGTMYAAYELLERLGVVFQLTGDIIPERKPDLVLPELDVVEEPARKFRGVHVWHAYSWYMGLADYRRLIDQLAKMKMNVLQFFWGMGAPWVEVFHEGVRGELTTTPESGYLAIGKDTRSWGRSVHTTTGNRSEGVGRECFPHERLCAREVASEDEAASPSRSCARSSAPVRELWLVSGEAVRGAQPGPAERRVPRGGQRKLQLPALLRGGGPTGDPVALDIWEQALCAMIETYPEAARRCLGARAQDFDDDCAAPAMDPRVPSRGDPRGRQPLWSSTPCRCTWPPSCGRVHGWACRLFRGYHAGVDTLLPKEVWILRTAAMQARRCSTTTASRTRDLAACVDDGCELH